MPQVDIESLVSACAGGSSDRKVVCETVAADEHDWPPESIWLSGDAEYDWWDRNAAVVYERQESTKGISIFSSTNLNPGPGSNPSSQRFSKNLKSSKAAIIGLPKSQKSAFADAKSRRNNHHRPGNPRLFPKRSASIGKSGSAAVFEPSSPKVSCMGKVRSRRDRSRRLRARQRSSSSTSASVTVAVAAVERQKSSRRGRNRTGFFESVRAIFRSRKTVKKTDLVSEDSKKKKNKKRSNSRKSRGGGDGSVVSTVSVQNDASFEDSFSSEPPSLGNLNRFASGRRSESWVSGR